MFLRNHASVCDVRSIAIENIDFFPTFVFLRCCLGSGYLRAGSTYYLGLGNRNHPEKVLVYEAYLDTAAKVGMVEPVSRRAHVLRCSFSVLFSRLVFFGRLLGKFELV
jgi:hypothetical protein